MIGRPRAIRSRGLLTGVGMECFAHPRELPDELGPDGCRKRAALLDRERAEKLATLLQAHMHEDADTEALVEKIRRAFAAYVAHEAASALRPSPADEWADIQATIGDAEKWSEGSSKGSVAGVLNQRIAALPGSAIGALADDQFSAYAALRDSCALATWRSREPATVAALRLLTDGLRKLERPTKRTKRADAALASFTSAIRAALAVESRLCGARPLTGRATAVVIGKMLEVLGISRESKPRHKEE